MKATASALESKTIPLSAFNFQGMEFFGQLSLFFVVIFFKDKIPF